MPKADKMTENMCQFIQKKKHLNIDESIMVVCELLKLTQKFHETGNIILCLYPENIGIQTIDGKYKLTVNIRDINAQQVLQGKLDIDDRIAFAGFRAPELAVMDSMRIGTQTDGYSITALFYYCLTGKRRSRLQMFSPDLSDIREIVFRNRIDENAEKILYRILKKGLAHGNRNRYETLQEMERDLAELEKCILN